MKFFRFHMIKRFKLVLQSALFFFLLFILLMIGYIYAKNHFVYSDQELKKIIIEYFHKQNINISFDNIKLDILWRPNIVLNNVHLIKKQHDNVYHLKSKKIKISFGYGIFFRVISLYKVSIFDSQLDIQSNIGSSSIAVDKQDLANPTPSNFVLPKYVNVINGKVHFKNEVTGYDILTQHINIKLYTPNNQESYLELSGNFVKKNMENPIYYILTGMLIVNNRKMIGKNIHFILKIFPEQNQYDTHFRFNLNWDLGSNEIIFNDINLKGQEKESQLGYQGNIGKITFLDFNQVYIPKIKINVFQYQSKQELSSYLELTSLNCLSYSCLIENLNFGANYKNNDHSFVMNGSLMMSLDFENNSLVLEKLIFNSKKINDSGAIPLWVFNLKGRIFYKFNDFLLMDLKGLLDKQPIYIISEYEKTKEELKRPNKGYWKIGLGLSSFDIRPYIGEGLNQDSKTKLYDNFLKRIAGIFKVLQENIYEVKLKIGRLQFPNFFFSDIAGVLKYEENKIKIEELKGKFFDGDFLTQLEIELSDPLAYKLEQKLNNINIGVMLFYFVNFPFLTGNGDAYFSFQTTGNNVSEIISHLNGFSSLDIHKGIILGYDLEEIIYQQGKIKLLDQELVDRSKNRSSNLKKTKFDLFKFVSYWTNGISDTVALEINSPQFQVTGKGSTNLVTQIVNYSILLTGDIRKDNKLINITLPLRLVGSLLDPQYYIDYKQLLELLDDSNNKEETLKNFIKQQWNLIY